MLDSLVVRILLSFRPLGALKLGGLVMTFQYCRRDLRTDVNKLLKNHKEEKEEEKTALLLPTKNGKNCRNVRRSLRQD